MTEEEKDSVNVENTAQRDDLQHLAGGMALGTDGYITGMEAAGQAQLVHSTQLPYPDDRNDEPYLALGFEFGEPTPGDDLFREAKLPAGWKKEGSDHSMWSYVVDERGFRRVGVFYKAAFYDRRADLHLIGADRQETKAQADTYEAFIEWCPFKGWHAESRKDGDNLVRYARQQVLDENGRAVYDHDAHGWKYTGLVRERVIAMDGSTISEREYTDD